MDRTTLESLNIKIVLNVQPMATQLQPTDGLVLIRRVPWKDILFYWMTMTRFSNVRQPTCLGVKGKTSQSPLALVRTSMILLFDSAFVYNLHRNKCIRDIRILLKAQSYCIIMVSSLFEAIKHKFEL